MEVGAKRSWVVIAPGAADVCGDEKRIFGERRGRNRLALGYSSRVRRRRAGHRGPGPLDKRDALVGRNLDRAASSSASWREGRAVFLVSEMIARIGRRALQWSDTAPELHRSER